MRLRSFFAESVAGAIREARQDLGEDALLLRSRRAPEEYARLGAYEVVFGVQAPGEEPTADPIQNQRAHPGEVLDFIDSDSTRPSRRQKKLSAALIGFDLDRSLARAIAARIARAKPGIEDSRDSRACSGTRWVSGRCIGRVRLYEWRA